MCLNCRNPAGCIHCRRQRPKRSTRSDQDRRDLGLLSQPLLRRLARVRMTDSVWVVETPEPKSLRFNSVLPATFSLP